jgi:hypothetical protein
MLAILGSLDGLAEVACAQGRAASAARLFSLTTELRRRHEILRAAGDEARCASKIAELRTSLGAEAFAAEWVRGAAMPIDTAVSL